MSKRTTALLILSAITTAVFAQATQKKQTVEQRIESLVSAMTVEEKVGQLNIIVGETIITGPTMYTSTSEKFDDLIKAGKITGLFNVHGAAYTARLQKIAVEQSRLKIPLLFGADIIHGFKTVSPIPLGEAASWDLKAIENSARMAAREATSSGINLNFAPMVDISRDPRWGRISEGSGEDPYLGSMIAAARVRGFQGNSLSASNTLAACVKHYIGYGAAEAGRDYNTVDMSTRALYETYLPPFKAAINAGSATIMPSFNEFDGQPATANKNLLTHILRDQLGFKGLVISDYGAVGEIINHGMAANGKDAAKASIEAGTDMDMMSYLYLTQIPNLVGTGKLDIAVVDNAVRRVLKLKFDLGLFDNPYLYSDVAREKAEIRSAENIAVTRDIAKRSIVLLKNENQILPLKKAGKIAVIGPLADNKEDMNGSWSFFGEAQHPISILKGLREQGKGAEITFHAGCNLYDDNKDKFKGAVDIAANADVVVLVVGESSVMNGEGASRSNINLPGVQQDLVDAVSKAGKPVIVVLLNGRPLTLSAVDEHASAILETWTLGSEAGRAVADVLFGDYNPSGKLPVTFPRSVGQVPIYYNHKNTGRPYGGDNNEPASQRVYSSKYRDVKNTPLYPFGFGLSYTTFEYANLSLSASKINNSQKLDVTVTLKNTGTRDGEEVVQLYIRDLVGSVTRPVKELKGFQKVSLKAGESKILTFSITKEELSFYRADMTWGTEPGSFDVFVGGDSEHVLKSTFELTD